MAQNSLADAERLLEKGRQKMNGHRVLFTNQQIAVDCFNEAVDLFKLHHSWDRAGLTYTELALCQLMMDNKLAAAVANVNAAQCYMRCDLDEVSLSFEQAVPLFLDIGQNSEAAKCLKEMAELYESEQIFFGAYYNYCKAASLYDNEDVLSKNQCMLKVAQLSALDEKYDQSIEIYGEIAVQLLSDESLHDRVKGQLLNAGICRLCRGGGYTLDLRIGLAQYQELYPKFVSTNEYRLLADLADAIDDENIWKFSEAVTEFERMSPLDAWKKKLILRVKECLIHIVLADLELADIELADLDMAEPDPI